MDGCVDLLNAESDHVPDNLVRQRLGDGESNRPLRQLMLRELVTDRFHGLRTEREDAQVILRGPEPEQRSTLVSQRRHPVAPAVLSFWRNLPHQRPDVFECGSRWRVKALEVLIHR